MDINEIDQAFKAVVAQRGIGKHLGKTKQDVYKLRNRDVTLGTKLEVLYVMDKLRFKDGWDED